ncbi:MAG: type II toxin-antitoxin system RelE/ParE family toxin [Parachlamydiaceae bacterium]|nr:type II toxin-antitoxin system RelE/ParE family toxin [Parachlamydiaceae bacterium]
MTYKVFVNPKVEKALAKIDNKMALKIRNKIRELAKEPRHDGAIKLQGEENAYRTRVGDYRIIYEIYDAKVLVMVINVGHRKEVYS